MTFCAARKQFKMRYPTPEHEHNRITKPSIQGEPVSDTSKNCTLSENKWVMSAEDFFRVCSERGENSQDSDSKEGCAHAATKLWMDRAAPEWRIFKTLVDNKKLWTVATRAFSSVLELRAKEKEPRGTRENNMASIATLLRAADAHLRANPKGSEGSLFGDLTQTRITKALEETQENAQADRKMDDDRILIVIKTGVKFYNQRILQGILKTWWPLTNRQTYFVGDEDNAMLQTLSGGKLIPTQCAGPDLCCKYQEELNVFWRKQKSGSEFNWFCHVDDDVYLLPRNLQLELATYEAPQDLPYFLGVNPLFHNDQQWVKFQADLGRQHSRPTLFIGGGPHGMDMRCLSAGLLKRVETSMGGRMFESFCKKQFNTADDMAEATMLGAAVPGTHLSVIPGAYIKHHRTNKLPYFDQKLLQKAIMLPNFEDLRLVHKLVFGTLVEGEWFRITKKLVPYASTTQRQPGDKGKSVNINWCKLPMPPPEHPGQLFTPVVANTARWCGFPAIVSKREASKMCRLNEGSIYSHSYLDVHYDRKNIHRWVDEERACPFIHASVPAFWGIPATNVETHAGDHHAFEPTCCLPNPDIPAEDGGDCYWTAPKQEMCTPVR